MANVAASAAAAAAAAANRDPAVDRSLRSVFGEFVALFCLVTGVSMHERDVYWQLDNSESTLANIASRLVFC